MIQFDRNVCQNPETAFRREWLETNGLGGFASSTIAGLNTRRYHGLLIAATKPPVGRMLLLSKLEETLVVDGRRYDLSANRYPGVVHPQGYRLLKEFRQDPFPVFVYEIEGLELEKSVFMVHGENTSAIQYVLRAPAGALPAACTLELRPLIAFRDYHGVTHENGALDPRFDGHPGNAVGGARADLSARIVQRPADLRHHQTPRNPRRGYALGDFVYGRQLAQFLALAHLLDVTEPVRHLSRRPQPATLIVSGRGSAWLERLVRDQEVGGSNPLAPTIFSH